MALTATIYHFQITLSDVDRGVYEALDLRVARHPSETMRYLVTRTLAYCLSYEEGIAFSKGGLSSAEEAPLSVRDATGVLRAWIDVGSPSAERLHKASKAAGRVALFTHVELPLLAARSQRAADSPRRAHRSVSLRAGVFGRARPEARQKQQVRSRAHGRSAVRDDRRRDLERHAHAVLARPERVTIRVNCRLDRRALTFRAGRSCGLLSGT